jgi:hypothetical protein
MSLARWMPPRASLSQSTPDNPAVGAGLTLIRRGTAADMQQML